MIFTIHQIFSVEQIETFEMNGTCGSYGGSGGIYRVLVEKAEEKRARGTPRSIYDNNSKMDL